MDWVDTYRRIARVDLKFDTKGAHAHLSEDVKDLITKVSFTILFFPRFLHPNQELSDLFLVLAPPL